jgi:hypothetical protein
MGDYRGMIVPSAETDWAEYSTEVELARPSSGRLFRKHLLNKGELIYTKRGKSQVVNIDDNFIAALKRNFDNRVVDIVQVPVAGAKNEHTEDPFRNIGEVIDLTEENGKIYAIIDVRKDEAADSLGKTLLGASALIDLDALDTSTGQKVGPALVHACVTNNPYVTGLEEYQEIVAASSDSLDKVAVFASTSTNDEVTDTINNSSEIEVLETPNNEELEMSEEKPKTLDELLAELKTQHGIDVTALQELENEVGQLKEKMADSEKVSEEVKAKDEQIAELESKVAASAPAVALTQVLTKALQEHGALELSSADEEITDEDVIGAVAELAKNNTSLSSRIEALELTNKNLEHERAVAEVESLVSEGKILPAKKSAMLKLRLSNEEMFQELIPNEPIVKLSNERGLEPSNDDGEKLDVSKEVKGLMERYSEVFKAK